MSEEQVILPALKPHDWSASGFVLCRPLITVANVPFIPWVGFGYDHAHTFEFVSRDSFPSTNTDETLRMIEQAALRNLRQRPVTWRIERVPLGWGVFGHLLPQRVLLLSGDMLAAERILDAQAMKYAAKMLRARKILVGIPCRGVLVATNARQSSGRLAHFSGMVSTQYHSNHTAPISPSIYIVENGQITGALTGQEQAGLMVAPAQYDGKEKSFFRAIITADRATGQETLHLLAGAADFHQLETEMVSAFAKSVEEMMERSDFSGQVRIILVPELVARTTDLDARIAYLQNHFAGIAAELNQMRPLEKPLQVSVIYGAEGILNGNQSLAEFLKTKETNGAA